MTGTAIGRREALVTVFREASVCTKCALSESRSRVVFGAGNADADLIFVGEAPGAEEDRQGLPFVGRSGALLDTMLGEIGMSRDDVFIANVLKCRPPENRDPKPEEIETCRPYLLRQIELIEPAVICTLGNFATKLLSGDPTGITRVHGVVQVHEFNGRQIQLFPLFHPAAALRSTGVAEKLRADIAALPKLLRRATGQTPPARTQMPVRSVITTSAEQSEAAGHQLAGGLKPGDVVILRGEMGAGKSTFIRAASRALGVEGPMPSPTFTIGRMYLGRMPVAHLDLFRLGDIDQEEPGLLDDYLTPDTIGFVEWPEAALTALEGANVISVVIEHRGGDTRSITIDGQV